MFNAGLLALGLVLSRLWSALKPGRRRSELGAQVWREASWESPPTSWSSLLAQMWACWVSFTASDHSQRKAFLKDLDIGFNYITKLRHHQVEFEFWLF